MGTVDAHHIHSGFHQRTNLVLRVGGWAESTDDFGTTHSSTLSRTTGETERIYQDAIEVSRADIARLKELGRASTNEKSRATPGDAGLAETTGFEPARGEAPNTLAGCRFRPLSHVSKGFNSSEIPPNFPKVGASVFTC